METKFLSLDWKADEAGVIEGYGSIFDNVDNGGDVVAPGAFAASLAQGRKVKMLLQHDPHDVIGVWDQVEEDGKGLRVKGRLLMQVRKAADAYELVKAGALDGLSIGYRTTEASRDRDGNRVILKAEVWEVSLVTFPMNEMARIDAVKAAGMTERDIERVLTQDAGLSRSVARRLMAGGYNAVKAMQDAGAGADELAALLKARLSL
ncbi:HK97 family phage prohead protease [Paracoccus sp. (in: a-proteobacteria)]|uniref:HK97 family phage prohead protease n=1 Tax=Paracoccus sp. TaxID=267 RepID=UPI00322036BE